MNKTTNKTRLSDKGKNVVAFAILIALFLIASVMTADFSGFIDSNPSSVSTVSYTMSHDNANFVSNER